MINFNYAEKLPSIKYENGSARKFEQVLKQRIDEYFKTTGQSRYANWAMHLKTVILLLVMWGFYVLIISNQFLSWDLILLQCGFHLASFIVWVGIAHDAHHHAYTKNKLFNKFLIFIGDTTGVSSYLMDYNHCRAHHSAVNIPHHDVSIDSFGVMRFHPGIPWKPFHRYQHLYIWPIYGIATLFKLFLFDFFTLMRKSIGAFEIEKHLLKQVLYMIFMKLATIGYTLILPMLVLDVSPLFVMLGFLIGHFFSGLFLSLIFQVTHLCDYSMFTNPDEEGTIHNSFAIHVMENTSTFSPNVEWMSWFSGGLNHHTIHHIYSNICQIHFYKLTPILRETAREFGIPFKEYPSLWAALKSHYRVLKKLGTAPNYQPERFVEYALNQRYNLK